MKSLVSVTMFATCLLAISQNGKAQDCTGWTNWDLRGTYTMAGSGWIDLSKLVSTLPAGTIPMSWVGATSFNGNGAGSGWVSVNAGGVQMNMDLVGLTYQVKADCSVSVSYSMKVKELGITFGPVSRLLVVGGNPAALELYGIQVGAGPGMPLDLMTKHRVSMQFK